MSTPHHQPLRKPQPTHKSSTSQPVFLPPGFLGSSPSNAVGQKRPHPPPPPTTHTSSSSSTKRRKKGKCTTSKETQSQLLSFLTPSSFPTSSKTVLDYWYWVDRPTDATTTKRTKSDVPWYKKDLTAVPKASRFVEDDATSSFPVYVETSTQIGIPRFYGIEKFGLPQTDNLTQGVSMNPDVKFKGQIRNTNQHPQVQATDAWLRNNGQGVISLPCGSGKTLIAIYLAVLKKRRTLILVHKEDLIDQWTERIAQFAPNAKVGKLQQKKAEIDGYDFVLGMIHSVARQNYDLMDTFGMVVVDEAHHLGARTFSKSIPKVKCKYTLGLSATPKRKDGLTHLLYWLLGPMVFQSFRCDIKPQNIRQILYRGGIQKVIQYKNGRLGFPAMITRMTKDHKRNRLIINEVRNLLNKPDVKKTILVSDRIDHLKYLEKAIKKFFPEKTCSLYVGGMKAAAREEAKECSVLCASYGMAEEALDIKNLNAMVLCTPYGNTEQVIGRLRESKTQDGDYHNRYVVDVVDCFDIYDHMAWKRYKLYKKLNYCVERIEASDEYATIPSGPSVPSVPSVSSGTDSSLVSFF